MTEDHHRRVQLTPKLEARPSQPPPNPRASSDGIAFANVGERGTTLATVSKEKEKVWEKPPPIETIECYAECNKMGHYSNQCPEKTGIQLLMAGVESDEFYDDAYYITTSFQFLMTSFTALMFHQQDQVLTKS